MSGDTLPMGKHTARLHRYLSHGHFLPGVRRLLSPVNSSIVGLGSSAAAWGELGCAPHCTGVPQAVPTG